MLRCDGGHSSRLSIWETSNNRTVSACKGTECIPEMWTWKQWLLLFSLLEYGLEPAGQSWKVNKALETVGPGNSNQTFF